MSMDAYTSSDPISAPDVAIAFVIFVGTIGLLSFDWQIGIGGGVSIVGAERILAGDIPYRDFWTMYAPGHFYLSALLFKIFGFHILVDWVAATVITAAGACGCYFLVRTFGSRFAAVVVAVIYLSAMYNTGYFKHLGSYPTSSLLIFGALTLVAGFFVSASRKKLFCAGLLTGAAIVFKHDVGGYTAAATVAGLIAFGYCSKISSGIEWIAKDVVKSVLIYSAGCLAVAVPVFVCFRIVAGPDISQDLVYFPLTDFPFSRPENYPSLWPTAVIEAAGISRKFSASFDYLSFTLPFVCLMLGIVAVVFGIRKRQPFYTGMAVVFCILLGFHYTAAHVQINTHIISMSVYGVLLGTLSYRLITFERNGKPILLKRIIAAAAAFVWIISLAVPPMYLRWSGRGLETAALDLPRVSGTRLPVEETRRLSELWTFVNEQTLPEEPIYVGLHRHDVLLIGDYMLYYILDRPGATRYDELHPAITDTSLIQREMIGDLKKKRVRLMVLEQLVSDEKLDELKVEFQRNLPNVGATELDSFIQNNYRKVQQFGRYEVWMLKSGESDNLPSGS